MEPRKPLNVPVWNDKVAGWKVQKTWYGSFFGRFLCVGTLFGGSTHVVDCAGKVLGHLGSKPRRFWNTQKIAQANTAWYNTRKLVHLKLCHSLMVTNPTVRSSRYLTKLYQNLVDSNKCLHNLSPPMYIQTAASYNHHSLAGNEWVQCVPDISLFPDWVVTTS